jgi:enoyl-CoA hydratase
MRRARAAKMGLPECLEQDWALVGHFVAGEADYWEGVRARLIDKDEAPAWKFRAASDVPQARVDALLRLGPGQRRLGLARGGGGGGGGSEARGSSRL